MSSLRDIFINSLCNFTHLHSPSTMRAKNALAFKFLLRVATSVGDHLGDRCGLCVNSMALMHARHHIKLGACDHLGTRWG